MLFRYNSDPELKLQTQAPLWTIRLEGDVLHWVQAVGPVHWLHSEGHFLQIPA